MVIICIFKVILNIINFKIFTDVLMYVQGLLKKIFNHEHIK